jgi:hypothetical protein
MPDPLPDWPAGTVCVLATSGADGPHAIPVSTAVRVAGDRIVLALAQTRGSLERLRAQPRVALTVVAGPDLAFTAHGTARVVADPLAGVDGVSGVEIRVSATRRHERPTFAIDAGVAWRWTDTNAQARDGVVRAALLALGTRTSESPH